MTLSPSLTGTPKQVQFGLSFWHTCAKSTDIDHNLQITATTKHEFDHNSEPKSTDYNHKKQHNFDHHHCGTTADDNVQVTTPNERHHFVHNIQPQNYDRLDFFSRALFCLCLWPPLLQQALTQSMCGYVQTHTCLVYLWVLMYTCT